MSKGNLQKKWTVPKTFLTKTSEFFQKCCNGEWKEASTRTVELPETDPDEFAIYLQWLYTGDLVANEDNRLQDLKTEDWEARIEGARTIFPALIALGILADMLMDPAFENAIVDEIIMAENAISHCPSSTSSKTLYDNVSGRSNIKRLIVDFYATKVDIRIVREQRATCHEDMIFDIMIRLHEDRKQPADERLDKLRRPSWEKRCKYHTHNDKVPKCT